MKFGFNKGNKRWLTTLTLAVALFGLASLPLFFRTHAQDNSPARGASKPAAFQPIEGAPNYDIRTDKNRDEAALENFRQMKLNSARRAKLANASRAMQQAEDNLAARITNLKIERSETLATPEAVGVKCKCPGFLTAPSTAAREQIVRSFVQQNASLYGLTGAQAAQLRTTADYTNPAGNLSWVEFHQDINGIPVFQGELRAALTKDGEVARTTGLLAPGLDYSTLVSSPVVDPVSAAITAAESIGVKVDPAYIRVQSTAVDGRSATLSQGPFVEKIKPELNYFVTEKGVAVLAWSMYLWQDTNAYYILVDAETGTLLWRKNITDQQTQSVTYNVYNDDSPAPLSPSNALPGSGIQGTSIPRTDIIVVNEMPAGQAYSNDPWIADGAGNVVTTGNNVDAGLDIDGTNGIDAAGRATGTGRVLSFNYNPPPGGSDSPALTTYRNGIVTNIFFWTNRYHDRLYQLGFNEQARNFQSNNYGRGGLGSDFVRAEAQDSSGTNNANFSTPADGSLPRMQMYIFSGPTPQRDGDIDGDVFVHEMTHGLSNRLHANASGLTNTQGGGMGEGWSDYYARAILSSASEDVNGIYAAGGYVTLNINAGFTDNYYYGIRRFPYAVKTNVGGPTATNPGKPHNPLTFADVDPAQISLTDGAYARGPIGSATANEVHNIGEVWCMMLLEVRARIITRMGWAAGNQRALQIVTDAMKLDVASPTMVQARDSILAADCAGFGGADEQDIWAGFATRGMGQGATTNGTSVTESFETPNLSLGSVTFTDTAGNNNGFADPGETIALSVPLTNPFCGSDATTTTASITGGGNANYGTIIHGATGTQTINYSIPAGTACGTTLSLPIVVNSSLGQVTRNYSLTIGQPIVGFSENFDSLTPPALPAGWTTAVTGGGVAFVSSATTPASAPNDIFTTNPTTTSTSEVITPNIAINSASAQVSFKNLFNTESGFDGMVLEISIPSVAGGAYQDILTAGGSFVSGGYTGAITQSGTCTDPLTGRQAWTGLSGGTTAAPTYINTVVNLPAAANGQNIKLKWKVGADCSLAGSTTPGVRVDSITVTTGAQCAPVNNTPPRRISDFDGDGKADLAVFRPSEGNWYIMRSSDSTVSVTQWGASTDKPVPGDYDGDNKTDIAVFRPSEGNWYILKSTGGQALINWGASGDLPVQGDYDGDGMTDAAVFRPSEGNWYVKKSGGGSSVTGWGASTDKPVAGDYDGDGKTDVAVWRPSEGNWYIINSGTNTVTLKGWGQSGDRPVQADYDGDRKTDVAVFRPAEGNWYIVLSSGGAMLKNWGASSDVNVPADYDGDGHADIAVFRAVEGNWYIVKSSNSAALLQNFGGAGDLPVPSLTLP